MKTKSIEVTVNGRKHLARVAPRLLLCDYLRDDLELTGTHVGCSVGTCGSCTILLEGRPVRSCLMLAVQVDEKQIRTVEDLGEASRLHPVQKAFQDHHALQCGFCTPGLLMSVVSFLEQNLHPTEEEIIKMLSGHLCRCTGYQNIVTAVKAAAEQMRLEGAVPLINS